MSDESDDVNLDERPATYLGGERTSITILGAVVYVIETTNIEMF